MECVNDHERKEIVLCVSASEYKRQRDKNSVLCVSVSESERTKAASCAYVCVGERESERKRENREMESVLHKGEMKT